MGTWQYTIVSAGRSKTLTVTDVDCGPPLVIPVWWIRYFGCKKEALPFGQQRRPKVTPAKVQLHSTYIPLLLSKISPLGGPMHTWQKFFFCPTQKARRPSRQWNKATGMMIIHMELEECCVSAFVLCPPAVFFRGPPQLSLHLLAAGHPASSFYISPEFMRLIERSCSLISSHFFPYDHQQH